MATNKNLKDKTLRAILANEKNVWRKLARRGFPVSLDTKTGFITALYRAQWAIEHKDFAL
jgi:hypothetical protein